MSQERPTTEITGVTPNEKTDDIRAIEDKAQRRARLIQVLDRGVVSDRLSVPLPPDVHGEWVRNDPLEVDRMKTLGFELDTQYAPKRSIHANETSAHAVVGDVIFMTCPKEIKEEIDAIRQDQFFRVNGKPGEQQTREEKEYAANVKKAGDVSPIVESQTRPARIADIANAMNTIDSQTQTSGSNVIP